MDRGPQTPDPWTLDPGPRTLSPRPWTLDPRTQTLEPGPQVTSLFACPQPIFLLLLKFHPLQSWWLDMCRGGSRELSQGPGVPFPQKYGTHSPPRYWAHERNDFSCCGIFAHHLKQRSHPFWIGANPANTAKVTFRFEFHSIRNFFGGSGANFKLVGNKLRPLLWVVVKISQSTIQHGGVSPV